MRWVRKWLTVLVATQNRLGDAAEMAMMELVDYNEVYTREGQKTAAKAKSTRRSSKKAAPKAEAEAPVEAPAEEVKE